MSATIGQLAAPTSAIGYLCTCTEAHADKFPVPTHIKALVSSIRESLPELIVMTEENARLHEALTKLERAASAVQQQGARPGSQWFKLSGALIQARAALGEQQ